MKKPSGKTKTKGFSVCKYKYKTQGAWGFKWDGKERLRVPGTFLSRMSLKSNSAFATSS